MRVNKKVALKHQSKRIKEFLEDCKSKFYDKEYRITSPFFDVVCNGSDEDFPSSDPDNFIIEDFDVMLDTKDHADIFFSFYVNSKLIWEENYLSHWGSQTDNRYERWKNLCKKIDSYCMKYYNCHWGEQNVTCEEEIPSYKPLIPIHGMKDIIANMTNRPLYKGKSLIGFIKDVHRVGIITGYHHEVDPVDGDSYPNVPDWKYYNYSVLLYGNPKNVNGVRFYVEKHTNNTYILGDDLDGYSVFEDKVVID